MEALNDVEEPVGYRRWFSDVGDLRRVRDPECTSHIEHYIMSVLLTFSFDTRPYLSRTPERKSRRHSRSNPWSIGVVLSVATRLADTERPLQVCSLYRRRPSKDFEAQKGCQAQLTMSRCVERESLTAVNDE